MVLTLQKFLNILHRVLICIATCCLNNVLAVFLCTKLQNRQHQVLRRTLVLPVLY